MNLFSRISEKINPTGVFIAEDDKPKSSSNVNDQNIYSSDQWITPYVPFKQCQEYYLTVGKVQNTVESFVNQIINRDWYFDGKDDAVKKMEEWETKYKMSDIFESIIRDWCQCGNHILGKSDYKPVMIESIYGLKRQSDGTVTEFGQVTSSGEIRPLKADKFFFTKYIDLGRKAWGVGLYQSLMTTFKDIDDKDSKPLLSLYRQSLQDNAKIHHKMGSPRSIWFFDVAKNVLDNDIQKLVKGMKAGDRITLNKKPEIITESIDGKTRFTEATQQLDNEVQTGLQSSTSRLITNPSAMADAKEAGEQDDERVKGFMEKLRRFMDDVLIPHITGKPAGEDNVCFKWGTKDSFSLNYPLGLQGLFQDGIVDEEIVLHILTNRLNWDIPDDMINRLKEKWDKKRNTPEIPNLLQLAQQNQIQKNPDEEEPTEEEKKRIEVYEKISKLVDSEMNNNSNLLQLKKFELIDDIQKELKNLDA